MLRSSVAAGVVAFALCSAASAAVLRLAHDETTQRLRVYDGPTASAVSLSTIGLGVQAGSISADAAGDRVFFVSNASGSQLLHALGYGISGGIEQASLPGSLRLTHLEWDGSGAPRLVGVAIDTATGAAVLVAFQAGALTSLGMPLADCCVFRSGVSAFRASDDSLFLVGRVAGESQDRIFRFTLSASPAVTSALIDADLQIVELATASDGRLYGIGHSRAAVLTRLIAFDVALQAEIRGAGVPDCCLVLAGSAAIDPVTADLLVLGSASSATVPGPQRIWRFDLASGAIVDEGGAAPGVGLFHDAGTVVPGGDLFADGFEQGAPLPRPRATRAD